MSNREEGLLQVLHSLVELTAAVGHSLDQLAQASLELVRGVYELLVYRLLICHKHQSKLRYTLVE